MSGFDWEALVREVVPVLDEHMCYVDEWIDEDLPLEDADSTTLGKLVEQKLRAQEAVSPVLENYRKKAAPSKEGPPQCAVDPPPRESVLVFEDAGGLCRAALESAPAGRVAKKKFLDGWDMSEQEIASLLASGWSTVVFGHGLDLPDGSSMSAVLDHNTAVSQLYFKVLKGINAAEGSVSKLATLTRGQFSNERADHEHAGLALVASGTLYGMTMTGKVELAHSGVLTHYVDIDYSVAPPPGSPKQPPMAERIASELFRNTTFGQANVRLMHSGRYVMRLLFSSEYEHKKQRWLLPLEGTIGISGGNGALGLVMGGWLLEQAAVQIRRGFELKVRIEFLSRSANINDPNNLPMWQDIQRKAEGLPGVEVVQRKLDMSDRTSIDDYVASVTPNLVGFIHSAGVLRDSILMNMTWEKFEDVFNSKHRAALYLHDALDRYSNPNLEFLWMFSSVAVYGNMGQLNYSGSNSFLDNLCRHRLARGLPGTAMRWGGWGEVGMAASMDEVMRRRMNAGPMPSFSTARGLRGMEAGLRTGLPAFSVFQINGMAFAGIVQGHGNFYANYQRLFYADLCPPSPLPEVGEANLYPAFVQSRGNVSQRSATRLVQERFGPRKALEFSKNLAVVAT
mmetsp:Transcript_27344/g.63765  ORF Transcript_27344/g.63765 Transcript_27344/m.63765 type:complete len:623 (+) Transcript_27344:121-1989(+)